MANYGFIRRELQSFATLCLLAVLSVAGAILAAAMLTRLLSAEAIASSLLCAVIVSAWIGGFGSSLLTIAIALLAFHYYLAPPANSFVWKHDLFAMTVPGELPRLVLFALTTTIVAFLISTQRKATKDLQCSANELRVAVEDQKRTEAALRRSEMYLNEAQRLSGTGSFGWSVTSGDIVWSDQTLRIFGLDEATKPTVELIVQCTHPEDRAAVRMTIDRAARGEDFDHEHRLLLPDGSVRHVHAVARAEKDASGGIELVGAVTDVTTAKGSGTETATQRGLFGRSPALEQDKQLGVGCSSS